MSGGRGIVRDDPEAIRSALATTARRRRAQVIITTGGTGITSRDSTYEASATCSRSASKDSASSSACSATRNRTGGDDEPRVRRNRAWKVIVSLPGSENAVRLAMNKLLLPELDISSASCPGERLAHARMRPVRRRDFSR